MLHAKYCTNGLTKWFNIFFLISMPSGCYGYSREHNFAASSDVTFEFNVKSEGLKVSLTSLLVFLLMSDQTSASQPYSGRGFFQHIRTEEGGGGLEAHRRFTKKNRKFPKNISIPSYCKPQNRKSHETMFKNSNAYQHNGHFSERWASEAPSSPRVGLKEICKRFPNTIRDIGEKI